MSLLHGVASLLIQRHIDNLTPQNAIENQPEFRKAAKDAYYRGMVSQNGLTATEGSFVVNDDGKPSPITTEQVPVGRDAGGNQVVYQNDIAAVHTHPPLPGYGQQPSPADIAAAKQLKRPIMVVSRDGLYEIDALGNVRKVFDGTNWMNPPKAPKHGR